MWCLSLVHLNARCCLIAVHVVVCLVLFFLFTLSSLLLKVHDLFLLVWRFAIVLVFVVVLMSVIVASLTHLLGESLDRVNPCYCSHTSGWLGLSSSFHCIVVFAASLVLSHNCVLACALLSCWCSVFSWCSVVLLLVCLIHLPYPIFSLAQAIRLEVVLAQGPAVLFSSWLRLARSAAVCSRGCFVSAMGWNRHEQSNEQTRGGQQQVELPPMDTPNPRLT